MRPPIPIPRARALELGLISTKKKGSKARTPASIKRSMEMAAVPHEFHEQVRVFKWAAENEVREPRLRLLHSSQGGVKVLMGLARKMKAAGNKKGVPDIFLPVQFRGNSIRADIETFSVSLSGGMPGLFIELKRLRGGKVSSEQYEWHRMLREQKYLVLVCEGADAAIAALRLYLRMGEL